MIRMAWHSAGTYRVGDGRGGAGAGQQRFAPLNSWPDNVSLDKARRLLWPVKKKYGQSLSWADLMILAGNVALETMGFETFGYAGGRADVWEPDDDVYWGPETAWLADERYQGDRELGQAARRGADGPDLRQPGGPQRQPGPAGVGPGHPRDLRPDGHERRGDRRADRRRSHLRQDPRRRRPTPTSIPTPRPRRWRTRVSAGRTTSARARVTTPSPPGWRSPGPTTRPAGTTSSSTSCSPTSGSCSRARRGANQWRPKNGAGDDLVPAGARPVDASREPRMLTSDLALRVDPAYEKISRRFYENPEEFADAFARAWFKLTHRDMGPLARYLGSEVPSEELLWQDPLPAVDHELIDDGRRGRAQAADPGSGPDHRRSWWRPPGPRHRRSGAATSGAASTAPASASPRRRTGRSTTRCSWPRVLETLEGIQSRFNEAQTGGKRVSLADLIVLAGNAAVEQAARAAGVDAAVPFHPGRTDASQEQTDVESFGYLEPVRRRVPQLRGQVRDSAGRVPAGRQGQPAHPERAGDDRAGRRPAGARTPTGTARRSACSPTGRVS